MTSRTHLPRNVIISACLAVSAPDHRPGLMRMRILWRNCLRTIYDPERYIPHGMLRTHRTEYAPPPRDPQVGAPSWMDTDIPHTPLTTRGSRHALSLARIKRGRRTNPREDFFHAELLVTIWNHNITKQTICQWMQR